MLDVARYKRCLSLHTSLQIMYCPVDTLRIVNGLRLDAFLRKTGISHARPGPGSRYPAVVSGSNARRATRSLPRSFATHGHGVRDKMARPSPSLKYSCFLSFLRDAAAKYIVGKAKLRISRGTPSGTSSGAVLATIGGGVVVFFQLIYVVWVRREKSFRHRSILFRVVGRWH